MAVISLRLRDKDFKRVNELSRMEHKDKSTVARELMEHGWEFLMIKFYREGNISLNTLASRLELSMSETIDLLSKFGIESPIDYDDYIKGFEVFSSIRKFRTEALAINQEVKNQNGSTRS